MITTMKFYAMEKKMQKVTDLFLFTILLKNAKKWIFVTIVVTVKKMFKKSIYRKIFESTTHA